jgi:hypothetical protein
MSGKGGVLAVLPHVDACGPGLCINVVAMCVP